MEFVAISCTERVQPNSTRKHVQIPVYRSKSNMPAWHHPWQRCERRISTFQIHIWAERVFNGGTGLALWLFPEFCSGTKIFKFEAFLRRKFGVRYESFLEHDELFRIWVVVYLTWLWLIFKQNSSINQPEPLLFPWEILFTTLTFLGVLEFPAYLNWKTSYST